MFATTAVALGCGSGGDAHPQTGAPSAAAQTALTVEREVVVDFDVPAGAALGDFAIVSGGLQIDPAAKVMSASGKFGGVAHVGADAVRVGRDVELGTLVSVGDVAIGDGVSFHGDLRTAGAISAPPPVRYTVEGTTTAGASIALRKLSRRAQFGATQPAIRLGPSAPSMIAAPGATRRR